MLQDWGEEGARGPRLPQSRLVPRIAGSGGPTTPRGAHQAPRGAGCDLTCLPREEKRRAPPGIGQVGRLRRCAGAGGSKLERFLVTDSPPPPPRRSQFLPSKAQLFAPGLAVSEFFGFVWAPTVAWNPFPLGLLTNSYYFLRTHLGVTELSLLFCSPPSQLRAPSFEPSQLLSSYFS